MEGFLTYIVDVGSGAASLKYDYNSFSTDDPLMWFATA
jgi:hypothetical protein